MVGADEPFVIHPGEFVLGRTGESVELPDDIVARIEGKSSLGRLGLIVHATAGFVDPGFKGTLTLEITNLTRVPIKLCAGPADRPAVLHGARPPGRAPLRHPRLGSHYQGQVGRHRSRYGVPAARAVASPPAARPARGAVGGGARRRRRSTSPAACWRCWRSSVSAVGFARAARGRRRGRPRAAIRRVGARRGRRMATAVITA